MTERDPKATLAATEPGGTDVHGPAPDGGTIGRYRVEGMLGQGGMGMVFRAHDPDLDRRVAIKVLHASLAGARKRLLKEGQAVARLRHPNVITVHDVGVHDDALFIAMELIEGGTLREALAARPHTPREIIDMFIAAGRGLAAAHAAGLVHRDFKPDNVLIDRDGRIVVGDFGLAQDGAAEITSPGGSPRDALDVTTTAGVAGTPAYMAPEQFRGKRVDARSDQFAFCVSLWEALYGERPFRGAEAIRTRSGVPSRVHAALRRGLSLDPDARFPSMLALLAELAPPRRTRSMFLAAAVVLGAGVLGTVLLLRPPGRRLVRADSAACRAGVDIVRWDPAAPYAHWFDQYEESLQLAYRARCVSDAVNSLKESASRACLSQAASDLRAAVERPFAKNLPWPVLRSLRECHAPVAERRDLTIQAPIGEGFKLSPDATRVVIHGWNGAPRIRELGTGREHSPLPDGNAIRWLDNERVVLARGGKLLVCSVASGAILDERDVPGSILDITVDLRRAVVEDVDGLAFVDLESGASLRLLDGVAGAGALSPDGRRIAVLDYALGEISIHDLETGGRNVVRAPSVALFGEPQVGWFSPDTLVIGGVLSRNTEGWLARVHVSGDGALSVPEPLVSAGQMATIAVEDVQPPHVLMSRIVVDERLEVRTVDGVRAAPSGMGSARAMWIDPLGTRLLVRASTGWSYVDLATWRTTPVPMGPFRGSEIISAQGAANGTIGVMLVDAMPVLFELEGDQLTTRPLPESLTRMASRARCRAEGCVVFGMDESAVEVHVVSERGYAPLVRFEPEGGIPGGRLVSFDVSTDRRRVVVTTFDGELFLIESGEKAREIHDAGCGAASLARFSADDRTLYYTCFDGQYSVRRVDLESGVVSVILSDSSTVTTSLEILPSAAFVLSRQTRAGALELATLIP